MSLEHRGDPLLEDAEVREVLRRHGERELGTVAAPPSAAPRRKPGAAVASLGVLAWAAWVARPVVRPPATVAAPGPSVRVAPEGMPYGPDFATDDEIDPSFRPGGPIPQGLALTARIGDTVWGCGDRLARGAQPPDGSDARLVEARVLELLDYVRLHGDASKAPPAYVEPDLDTVLPAVTVRLFLDSQLGGRATTLRVPTGNDARARTARLRLGRLAAKRITDATADSIQRVRQDDPSLP